ncbi:unnamed protein product [Cochlearia groenlandica]
MGFSFDLAITFTRERKRMKRSSKLLARRRRQRSIILKSQKHTHEICFDLVIEILTKLPSKSLMRFKSISKLWSSLVSSQYFTNRFLKVSLSKPRLYMWSDLEKCHHKNILLSSLACHDDLKGTTISSFVVDQDLTIPSLDGYSLSHVFRGLMCFSNGPSAQIYNTTTRQLVVLPDIVESEIIHGDHKEKSIMYHIGHDPVNDQYKVVCVASKSNDVEEDDGETFSSEHWVFLLGRDGSNRWRNIPSKWPQHYPITKGVNINGHMHYLVWVNLPFLRLVTLDINTEEIVTMLKVRHFWRYGIHPIEYKGKVALLHDCKLEKEGVIELWVIVEDAIENMWLKKTFVLDPSQMHLVHNISLSVVGTTSNGEVVFVPQKKIRFRINDEIDNLVIKPQSTNFLYVLVYNIEKNHIRKVEIIQPSNQYGTGFSYFVGFDDVENLIHL